MIENRSIRLRFLQGYLDLKNPKSLSVYDSSIIALVSLWKSEEDMINGLKSQEVVRSEYGIRCLKMDIWYLTKNQRNLPNIQRSVSSLSEFEQRVMFQIIIQSLIDVYTGRPCDESLWKGDISPDFRKCSSSLHLCKDYAEMYISSLGLELDSYVGLSTGCLSSLMHELKKRS